MKILIDSLSSQVQVQLDGFPGGGPAATVPGRRLNTLLGAIHSGGTSLVPKPGAEWTWAYSSGPIDEAQLDGCDVFFIMTHHLPSHATDPKFVWSETELDAIESFVKRGGGLLLMSNHNPYPFYDVPLAARFGVTLHNVAISNEQGWVNITGDLLNTSAFGETYLFGVNAIAAHDGCAFSAPPSPEIAVFRPIASFSSDCTSAGQPVPPDWYFAAHLIYGNGQVVFVANSGTCGDYGGNPEPACGAIAWGSNLMFVLNCLRLLGHQPQATALGSCPGGQG